MTALHPLFSAALGKRVVVSWLSIDPVDGTNAGNAEGILGVTLDRDDVPTELVIQTDGGATFVDVAMVVQLREIEQ